MHGKHPTQLTASRCHPKCICEVAVEQMRGGPKRSGVGSELRYDRISNYVYPQATLIAIKRKNAKMRKLGVNYQIEVY